MLELVTHLSEKTGIPVGDLVHRPRPAGRRVAVLVDGEQPAGRHSVVWSTTGGGGRGVASGTYVYRLTTGQGTWSRTLTLVK